MIRQLTDSRAETLADALTSIENRVVALLYSTGLQESLVLDECVADVSACDPNTANVELRWSKLKIPGYGPSKRAVARQLRAFADALEKLEMDL